MWIPKGFGLTGIPEKFIAALKKKNVRNLTCVSNDCGVADFGLGVLMHNGQIKKMIASYVGENKELVEKYLSGQVEVVLCPQVRQR